MVAFGLGEYGTCFALPITEAVVDTISIGTDFSNVKKIYGEPNYSISKGLKVEYKYGIYGTKANEYRVPSLVFNVDQNGKVCDIYSYCVVGVQTKSGIGYGSTEQEVLKAYGKPDETKVIRMTEIDDIGKYRYYNTGKRFVYHIDSKKNLIFSFDDDNNEVDSISLY